MFEPTHMRPKHQACTYVICAHNHPDAVMRLARVILTDVPDSRVVVHYSALSGPFPGGGDDRILNVENPVAVRWGTFSQMEMMLRSLELIRSSRLPREWIIMLSGQCYPARSLAELERMLSSSDVDAHFYFKRIEAGDRDLKERYTFNYRMVRDGPLPFPLNRRFFRGIINRLQARIRVKSTPRVAFVGLPKPRSIFDILPAVYFGTQWVTLSGNAADYIANAVKDQPELLDVYRGTLAPEESFFATLLLNGSRLRISNSALHYSDWSKKHAASPRSLLKADLPAIQESQKWFVRKIDPDTDDGLRNELDTLRSQQHRKEWLP